MLSPEWDNLLKLLDALTTKYFEAFENESDSCSMEHSKNDAQSRNDVL
jgi:hypothetical protein